MGKIVYQNEVFLRGIVADNVLYGKATSGYDYCSFSLIINDKDDISTDDTKSKEYIRIFVFNNKKKKMVEYLNKMGFRRGLYVGVYGKLRTVGTEHKGIQLVQIIVDVRDIFIIQTKPTNKG